MRGLTELGFSEKNLRLVRDILSKSRGTLIRERSDAHQFKQAAVSAGMATLLADALAKAIVGQTTIEEVIRVA